MTNLKILLLGGDARQKELYYLLKNDFEEIYSFGLFDNEKTTFDCDILVLPFPAFNGEMVNAPFSKIKISKNDILNFITPKTKVFGGKIPNDIFNKEQFIFDFANDEALTIQNAALTAEASIYYAIEGSELSLINSNILITGFGRIGKFLTRYLSSFTKSITISARKPIDFGFIKSLGYTSISYNELEKNIYNFDFVFNTVPYKIFDKNILEKANKETLFIDLASAPGGFEKESKIKLITALGLPGKHSPKTAAKIIYKTLRPYLTKEEKA